MGVSLLRGTQTFVDVKLKIRPRFTCEDYAGADKGPECRRAERRLA
jgi:hypothetical protein